MRVPIDELLANAAFEPDTVALLATAFDTAWDTVRKSGSPLALEGQAAATREALAKHIIDLGKNGERDPRRLVDHALARLVGLN
jgi:hypothetical protein